MEVALFLAIVVIVLVVAAASIWRIGGHADAGPSMRIPYVEENADRRAVSGELEGISPAIVVGAAPPTLEAQPVEISAGPIGVRPKLGPTKPRRTNPVVDLRPSGVPLEFVVLDLETTGLDPARHEIIEVGAIRTNRETGQRITFQALVKPEGRLPAKISRMTGISQSMLDSDGRPLPDVLAEFLGFIADLPLVTFNAPFDMGFLRNAARKYGVVLNNPYACALQMARRAWPELESHRLADLARIKNLPEIDTHRAIGDCTRALLIFTSAASKCGGSVRWNVD